MFFHCFWFKLILLLFTIFSVRLPPNSYLPVIKQRILVSNIHYLSLQLQHLHHILRSESIMLCLYSNHLCFYFKKSCATWQCYHNILRSKIRMGEAERGFIHNSAFYLAFTIRISGDSVAGF